MTTDTHDTAAALEAAIDAIACRRCDHDDPIGSTDHAALHRAITAHVEAEVARRLAAAPDVEAAIVDYALAAQGDFDTSEERDALRAAIAADKARAVAEVRAAVVGEGADRIVDAIAAAAARSLVAPVVAMAARPTPDEARRLVDALESRAAIAAGHMADYDESELDTARTALLRALGVEA